MASGVRGGETPEAPYDILPCSHVRRNAYRILTEYSGLPGGDSDILFDHYCNITKKIIELNVLSIDPLQHWADPYILLHPLFPSILERVKNGAIIFDHSDYFSTDLRALAMCGAPSTRMLTYNSRQLRWDLGHDAFKDRETFNVTCFGPEYLNPSKKWYIKDPFQPYRGNVDILWVPHRVYGLSRRDQKTSMLGLIGTFAPKAGFLLVGCHEGSKVTRTERRIGALGEKDNAWLPNAEDMGKMLKEVLTLSSGRWKVEVSLINLDQTEEFREHVGMKGKELIQFSCIRLE